MSYMLVNAASLCVPHRTAEPELEGLSESHIALGSLLWNGFSINRWTDVKCIDIQ